MHLRHTDASSRFSTEAISMHLVVLRVHAKMVRSQFYHTASMHNPTSIDNFPECTVFTPLATSQHMRDPDHDELLQWPTSGARGPLVTVRRNCKLTDDHAL